MVLRQINVRWESLKDLIQFDSSYCRRKTTSPDKMSQSVNPSTQQKKDELLQKTKEKNEQEKKR